MACRVVNQSIFLLLLGAHQKHITLPIAHQAHYPANKNLWLSLSALESTKTTQKEQVTEGRKKHIAVDRRLQPRSLRVRV